MSLIQELWNNRWDNGSSHYSWFLPDKAERHAFHAFVLNWGDLFLVLLVGLQRLAFTVDKSWQGRAIDIWVKNTDGKALGFKSGCNIDCNCTFSNSSFTTWDSYYFFDANQISFSVELILFSFGGEHDIHFLKASSLQLGFKSCLDSSVVFG